MMTCNVPSQNSLLYYLDENTFLTSLTSFTFAVIGIFIFIFSSYIFFDKHKIPKGSLPKVPYGNFKDVICHSITIYEYLRRYYNRFKRKEYPFAGLYLFFKPVVVVVDLTLQKNIFVDKNESEMLENIGDIFGDKNMEYYFEKMNRNKNTFVLSISEGKVPLEDVLYKWLVITTREIFGNLLEETLLHDIVKQKTTSSFKHYFNLAYPFFKKKKSVDRLVNTIEETYRLHKKNDSEIFGILKFICFDKKYSLKNNFEDLLDVFTDNIIYTHSSVLLGLYEIACNEDIREDLVGEIRRFIKQEQSLDLYSLEKLSYLESVVKEILRKYPPVPFVVENFNKKCDNLDLNLKLPKDILMIASILGVHRHPDYYLHPECFDPDRFNEDKSFINDDAYIPFGYKAITKLSSRITMISIKLAIFSILSHYKIASANKSLFTFDNMKMNMHPKVPLPIKLECIE